MVSCVRRITIYAKAPGSIVLTLGFNTIDPEAWRKLTFFKKCVMQCVAHGLRSVRLVALRKYATLVEGVFAVQKSKIGESEKFRGEVRMKGWPSWLFLSRSLLRSKQFEHTNLPEYRASFLLSYLRDFPYVNEQMFADIIPHLLRPYIFL